MDIWEVQVGLEGRKAPGKPKIQGLALRAEKLGELYLTISVRLIAHGDWIPKHQSKQSSTLNERMSYSLGPQP